MRSYSLVSCTVVLVAAVFFCSLDGSLGDLKKSENADTQGSKKTFQMNNWNQRNKDKKPSFMNKGVKTEGQEENKNAKSGDEKFKKFKQGDKKNKWEKPGKNIKGLPENDKKGWSGLGYGG